jgi:hypothetical protein
MMQTGIARTHSRRGWTYPSHNQPDNSTRAGRLEGGALVFRGTDGVLAAEKTLDPEPVVTARSTGDGTPAHVANHLDCVRTRKAPNAGVRGAVAAAQAAHMANAAYRTSEVVRG